jgi:two-component system LytT family response regulator
VEEIISKEDLLDDRIISTSIKKAEGKITLPQLDGFQVLNVSEILYCKADDNYTEIFMGDKKILVSKTLKYFEESLAQFNFVRIHKSFLVNINEVVKYRKGKGGSVVISNGKELMVSASRKKELLSYFE